jgi:sugar phosphate isomerase/epimerase
LDQCFARPVTVGEVRDLLLSNDEIRALKSRDRPLRFQITRHPPAITQGVAMQSSIQLWSLRLSIDEHGWDRAIGNVAAAGFRNVEPFALDRTFDLVRPAIEANGLSVPTAHGFLDGETIERTLANAAALGVRTVYHPHLDERHWGSLDAIASTAEMLNSAAQVAHRYDIEVGFHHHDYELRHVVDGRPAIDRLVALLAADVQIEYDMNWAAVARVDPLPVLSRLEGRLNAVHIKDGPLEGVNTDQRALGEGELDLDSLVAVLPEDALLVLSLDQFAGSSDEVGKAVATSRAWLDERGVQ